MVDELASIIFNGLSREWIFKGTYEATDEGHPEELEVEFEK